ncbi:unnamed protein product, partial [Ectocarpus sp. 13 AM-2016]
APVDLRSLHRCYRGHAQLVHVCHYGLRVDGRRGHKRGRRVGGIPDHDPGVRHRPNSGPGLQLHDPERRHDRRRGNYRYDAGASRDALPAVGHRGRRGRHHPGAGGGCPEAGACVLQDVLRLHLGRIRVFALLAQPAHGPPSVPLHPQLGGRRPLEHGTPCGQARSLRELEGVRALPVRVRGGYLQRHFRQVRVCV